MVRYKRGARKLYPTGAWPMKYHGQAAVGLTRNQINKARREMVKCSGAPKGCCTTTCIATRYRISQDPLFKARFEQVKEWAKMTDKLSVVELQKINKIYYKMVGTQIQKS